MRRAAFIEFGIAILFAMTCVYASVGQPSLGQPVKRLYVDTFQGKNGSAQLRDRVIERLRADRKWQIVDTPTEADVIVAGSGEIWVKGYVTNNPRSKGSSHEAVYGGYLSLEVRKRSGETLWSYLVTPGRMPWNGVDREMADHIVRLMDSALANGSVSSGPPASAPSAQLSIMGAGSTFAGPLYQKWIESFHQSHPEIRISYQAVGSESGIQALKESSVDFAASDVHLSNEQMISLPEKIHQYATVLGGVVVAYNLAGAGHDLRFTPEILAGIYLRKITRWNDQRLRDINRGARLPDEPIVVIHRSDGSGTTFAWTEFLSKTNAEWKSSFGAGMRVAWPTGQAAEGNEGVAAKVAETPGSIGYMELTYAIRHQLSFGLIRNPAGEFVQANLTTLAAAAKSIPGNSLINAPAKHAYPIATFTWIVVPESADNPQKTSAVRDLVRWILTSGQKECAGLGYLALPKEMADAQLRQLGAPAR